MTTSRSRFSFYLLVVGIGAAAVIASFDFGVRVPIEYPSLQGIGLFVLVFGLARLGRASDSEHATVLTVGGGLAGAALVIAAEAVGIDGLRYVGLAVLIAAALGLFVSSPPFER